MCPLGMDYKKIQGSVTRSFSQGSPQLLMAWKDSPPVFLLEKKLKYMCHYNL